MSFINILRGPDGTPQFENKRPKAPEPVKRGNPHGDSFKLAREDAVRHYQSIVKSAGPPEDSSVADLDELFGPNAGPTSPKPNQRA